MVHAGDVTDPGAGARRHRTAVGPLALLIALIGAALAVVWLGGVSAFTPEGRTPCGPAIQEWRNLFSDALAGRCHLARHDRLWLGVQVAAALLAVASAACVANRVAANRRSGPTL